jgi:predicted nucleotide-binding protein (sugar kinase/HSP70/actin superfamily)
MWNTIVKWIEDNKHLSEQKDNIEYAKMLLSQRNTSGGGIVEKEMVYFVDNGFKIPN